MARKISDWVMTDDECGAFRYYEGTNPEVIENRVAFIEKTPRIRIRHHGAPDRDFLNWASPPWSGNGPKDPESRAWCDAALQLFEYLD